MTTKRCLRCEAQISATAKWCQYCGSKQSRKSGLKIACIVAGALFIGFIALCSVAVAITALNTDTNAAGESQNRSTPTPAPTISAVELATAYEGNKLAADAQYKDKVFRIRGVPSDIGNSFGSPQVTFNTGILFTGVTCSFGRSWTDRLAALELGREITVQGKVTGHLFVNVGVDDCILVD